MREPQAEHLSVRRTQAATKVKIQQWFEFISDKLSDPKIRSLCGERNMRL